MASATVERPLRIEFGVFSDDVMDERGRVDVKRLAGALDLSMPTIAAALNLKPRALNSNPTSKNAQTGAIMLLASMNDLAKYANSKKLALNFLRARQPGLENKTPIDLLNDGKLQTLCTFIGNTVHATPD